MYNAVVGSFSNYLLSKIQEHEQQAGKRISLDEFARFIGVSRPLVSYWLKGTIPSLENVQLLANKFGPEVYDVLELPRPNPYLQKINKIFERLSPDHQRMLAEEAERYEVQNHAQNVQSPSHRRKKATSK